MLGATGWPVPNLIGFSAESPTDLLIVVDFLLLLLLPLLFLAVVLFFYFSNKALLGFILGSICLALTMSTFFQSVYVVGAPICLPQFS